MTDSISKEGENITPEEKKQLAEAEKIALETIEIKRRLGWLNTGLSWGAVLKAGFAGIVAGVLLYIFVVDVVWDFWKITETEMAVLEKQKKALEIKTKELEDVKRAVDEENQLLRAALDEQQEQESTKVADSGEVTEVQAVSNVHSLEEQASRLPSVEFVRTSESELVVGYPQWVYVGELRDNKWIKNYFDFPSGSSLMELKGKSYELSAKSLNIRDEKFNGEIIGILKQGEVVMFYEIEPYFFSNYIWARISKDI